MGPSPPGAPGVVPGHAVGSRPAQAAPGVARRMDGERAGRHARVVPSPVRPLNDPGQYDDLATTWEDPYGPLAMLAWLAASRASLIPPAARPGALLLDLACGGGLLAPAATRLGYRHVGIDLTRSALTVAAGRGVSVVQGDVGRLPVADAVADVVLAGEVLEHVPDPAAVVTEAARVLRPGGTLVIDSIAATRLARWVAVTLAERLPGGPPRGIHDPDLFVDRAVLVRAAALAGVPLHLHGLRPSTTGWIAWAVRRREVVPIRRTRSTAVLFAGVGRKAGTPPHAPDRPPDHDPSPATVGT